tara:strand:- start:50 stop:595 length:546 start_codon:yes stop_codon:yes gene_type:complete
MDNVVVIDDVISKGYQNLIDINLNCHRFPWFFLDNVTDQSKMGGIENITGFSCSIFHSEMKIKNEYADLLTPLLYEVVDKCEKGKEIKKLFRIRAGMFVQNQTNQAHEAHVDRYDFHYTVLYYVNDSDGPTKIFDYKGGKVIQEIEPKKGRAVIFTGDTYHASSSPKNHNNRIVVNYNFLV